MAMATIVCICKKCNKEFKVTKGFYNRQQADDWEDWAKSVDYYNMCTDCYRKSAEDEKFADGYEKVEMHYGTFKREYSDCKTGYNSYNDETKTIMVFVPNDYKKIKVKKKLISEIGCSTDYVDWIVKQSPEKLAELKDTLEMEQANMSAEEYNMYAKSLKIAGSDIYTSENPI